LNAVDVPAEAWREPLHGLRQIARLNWPFYAGGAAVVVLALSATPRLPLTPAPRGVLYAAAVLAAFWLAASLLASWFVYDRSNLMTGEWIPDALGFHPATWITIHAGFDETTPAVRTILNGSSGRVFDIFDPVEMTEPSIARARQLAGQDGDAECVNFRQLPVQPGTIDAALLLLSAHELRTHEARVVLFAEIHRVLAPGGRAVVAEHLRDLPNFGAFGPGCLHFHSRRSWMRSFARAGFAVHNEFSITPFVRVFILGEST